jgi:hypothetical protein
MFSGWCCFRLDKCPHCVGHANMLRALTKDEQQHLLVIRAAMLSVHEYFARLMK